PDHSFPTRRSSDLAGEVVKEIKSIPGMRSYNVRSMREYLSLMTPTSYPYLGTFIHVVIGISLTIGLIVIFQAMYTSVMERTREIGILKSMGASKAAVYIAWKMTISQIGRAHV